MDFTKFSRLASLIFLTSIASLADARINARLEDGLAITHPRLVETISQRASGIGLGLGYYLDPTGRSNPNLSNKFLSQLPLFAPVLNSLRGEVTAHVASIESQNKTYRDPNNTVGTGMNFRNRLFDVRFLEYDRATFALVGVINRLDKSFLSPQTCGETRLIYRLAYNVEVNGDKNKSVVSRLPMTINLILHAKAPGSRITCQEIARRWSDLNVEGLPISAAVDQIMGESGPLAPELRDRSLLKQIEVNLQLSRVAAGARPDFGGHAVYLLKVYKWNGSGFSESVLDNQVERSQAPAFFAWLFEAPHKAGRLAALDRGTIQIPPQFLAKRAYSTAPGGLSRAVNHSLYGKITDADIQKQLSGIPLEQLINIKSVAGFKRRLSDVSCTGCHQTRAVGGFHFMGQDPYRWVDGVDALLPLYPGNSVTVPGSGHFFGDLERRRNILNAFLNGEAPDFSTGFSSRPQAHHAERSAIEGNGFYNGWGAHCYNGSDSSFAKWTCSAGNKCLELHKSELNNGMGICISASGHQLGDPNEAGAVKVVNPHLDDRYTKLSSFPMPGADYVNSPQSANEQSKTGGFPGGSLRLRTCEQAPMSRHPEALCGALPAATSGFNDCLFNPKMTFKNCVDTYSVGVGMRGCSRQNPCRDDYICVESLEKNREDAGVCVPPYFLFQFRVDGHPVKF